VRTALVSIPLASLFLLFGGCAGPDRPGFSEGEGDDDTASDDDDDATDGPRCAAEAHGLFVACAEASLPRDSQLEGRFAAWSDDGATFETQGGDRFDLVFLVEPGGTDALPDLSTEPAVGLWVSGFCDDPDKGGTALYVWRGAWPGEPLLLASTREVTAVGRFTVRSPRDVSTCPGVDRGGCWTNEHAKPLLIDDGQDQWTAWQGAPEQLGPWTVSVNVGFSGSGDVRCDDCCSSERLGWYLVGG
jgi:hypothetical protein